MSHFTVTVKLSAKRLKKHDGNVEEALAEILAPYEESPKGTKYTEFVDVTDEHLVKYNTEFLEQVKLDDGTYVWPWDERFRVKGTFGTGSDTHKAPEDKLVNRKAEEVYGSFENYMKEYCGYKKNSKGRYGYRRNPNAKWDWWCIGGRWTGHFPLKSNAQRVLGQSGAFGNAPTEGCGDVVKVSDLDFDLIATQTRERAEKFFTEYQQLLEGKKFDAFDGPREQAMRMGLVEVVQKTQKPRQGEVALPWSKYVNPSDQRHSWTDICKVISKSDFLEMYTDCFNPILTYAALDDEGWQAPGEMGWFGMSSDQSEDYIAFKKEFVQRVIKSAKPDDVLVCVDCHI